MAHNLEIRDGKASFFSVKEKAWHGLGTIIQDCPTLEEAIKLGRLDWQLEKQPLYLANGNVIPNKAANVRCDTGQCIGVVSDSYKIVQNSEAFEFFNFLDNEACFETGGVLRDGQVVWLSAKLPAHFSIAGSDDLIEQYLFLMTSHDGSQPLQAMMTPVRVVCNNTLNIALKSNSNRIAIRHTSNASERVKEAYKTMGIINNLKYEIEDLFNRMHKVQITDYAVLNLITMAVSGNPDARLDDIPTRTKNIAYGINEYYHNHFTQSDIKGNIYGVYNAFTGYMQNSDYLNDERKMKSLLLGDNHNQILKRANNLILQSI